MLIHYKLVTYILMIICAFGTGWQVNGWRLNSTKQDVNKHRINTLTEIEQSESMMAQQIHSTNAANTREVIQYVVKNPTDCRLSDNGLQLWRASNAGTSTTDPALPATAATRGEQSERSTVQPRRSGGVIPPMPPTARQFNELDTNRN